jgi:arsenate reductase
MPPMTDTPHSGRPKSQDRFAMHRVPNWPTLVREALGTALISVGLIGAAVMAARVPGADPLALRLAVALAMGAALGLAMMAFGGGLRAHFNPALSFALMLCARASPVAAAARMAAQCVGALAGAVLAHVMLDMGAVQTGAANSGGLPVWLGEVFGAWLIVVLLLEGQRRAIPALALWAGIGLAFVGFITISLSAANPAISLARTISASVVGLAPEALAGIVVCQFIGAALAVLTSALAHMGKAADKRPERPVKHGREI